MFLQKFVGLLCKLFGLLDTFTKLPLGFLDVFDLTFYFFLIHPRLRQALTPLGCK